MGRHLEPIAHGTLKGYRAESRRKGTPICAACAAVGKADRDERRPERQLQARARGRAQARLAKLYHEDFLALYRREYMAEVRKGRTQ